MLTAAKAVPLDEQDVVAEQLNAQPEALSERTRGDLNDGLWVRLPATLVAAMRVHSRRPGTRVAEVPLAMN